MVKKRRILISFYNGAVVSFCGAEGLGDHYGDVAVMMTLVR